VAKLILNVEPGDNIQKVAAFAQDIADKIEAAIMFEFNGVECFAVPGGSSLALVELQQERQGQKPRVFSDDKPLLGTTL
jgi:hypothetical protein